MKTLALTIAAAVGFAGMAQDASAAKRRVSIRVGGGGFSINIGRRGGFGFGNQPGPGHVNHPGHNHGPGGFKPGIGKPIGPVVGPPVIVKPFLVKYHMHGSRKLEFNDYFRARNTARYLRNLGLHVKLSGGFGCYFVTYHMHGTRTRTFYDHLSAHQFEQQVERLGMHAKVIH